MKKKNLFDLETYKHSLSRIARELGYSKEILQKIKDATTEGEADRAMVEGRKGMRD